MEFEKLIEQTLSLRLPASWSRSVCRLHELLVGANSGGNLTRLTGREDFLYKHVFDSLLVSKAWPAIRSEPLRVADIGCGGGIPGLVLAITFPALELTEIDSSTRKIACVQEFIEALHLGGCRAIARRARELGHGDDFRGVFDIVVARAVSDTGGLIRECRRLIAPGGALVAYKTPAQVIEEAEFAAREARKAGFGVRESEILELPSGRGQRQFVIVERPGEVREQGR